MLLANTMSTSLSSEKICQKTLPPKKRKMPNSGNGRFYVGMTGLHPFERYLNHVRGYKASWATKRMAVTMIGFEGPMSHKEAKAREPAKAQELRMRDTMSMADTDKVKSPFTRVQPEPAIGLVKVREGRRYPQRFPTKRSSTRVATITMSLCHA